MATLTAAEIAHYRQLVGDDQNVEELTNDQMQEQYDRALSEGEDAAQIEALTVVYLVRRLWGKARVGVDQTGEFGRERRSQYFGQLKDLLDYWSPLAGLGGLGNLYDGTLSLGLDATEDDPG